MDSILGNNSYIADITHRLVKFKKHEDNLIAANRVHEEGITIIVSYNEDGEDVYYVVTCDGRTPFNDLPREGDGGDGAVASVNGQTGSVTLTAEDVEALPDTYIPPAQTWTQVTGKPTTFPPAAHTQAISTITGLQTALDAKGTSNLTLGTTPTTAKAGDYVPQVSEIKRDATNPLLTEMASFLSSQDIPTARARYASFLLIGSGGNNGASTQGARSDHAHAAIQNVPTINSAEIPITSGAASVPMTRQNFWCNIVDNTILTLTGIILNVEYTIDVTNTGAVQQTITLAGIPYSGNQDFSIPPGKGAIISIKQMDAARPVRAVISVDPA